MSTQLPGSDFDAFYAFLGELRIGSTSSLTPEESLRQFRDSQEKLKRFQELNEVAIEQSRQGLSRPLDLKEMLQRIEQRVAQKEPSS